MVWIMQVQNKLHAPFADRYPSISDPLFLYMHTQFPFLLFPSTRWLDDYQFTLLSPTEHAVEGGDGALYDMKDFPTISPKQKEFLKKRRSVSFMEGSKEEERHPREKSERVEEHHSRPLSPKKSYSFPSLFSPPGHSTLTEVMLFSHTGACVVYICSFFYLGWTLSTTAR